MKWILIILKQFSDITQTIELYHGVMNLDSSLTHNKTL